MKTVELLKSIRDDLLMRGDVEGDATIVNMSHSIWMELKEKIEQLEGLDAGNLLEQHEYDDCGAHNDTVRKLQEYL